MRVGPKIKKLTALLALGLVLVVFCLPGQLAAAGTQPKEITIATSKDNYPFHYADENGRAAGITVDFWNLWSRKTGIAVNYLISDWDTTLQNMKDKKADVHAGCFFSDERDVYMDYGFPIVEAETHIFYNAKLKYIQGLDDLQPYTIGVVKGDYAEDYVRNSLKNASIRTFDSYEAIMTAARDGALQVYVADTLTALSVMGKTLPQGLFTYNAEEPLYTSFFYATAQEGNAELIKRINSGMGSITQNERQAIMDKWLPRNGGGMSTVYVAISPDYPPFSYPDDGGNPQGFLVDLWRLWGQKTGTDVQFVMDTWSNTLKDIESGTADIHSGLFYTDDRSKYMNFSQMFYSIESRIFFNESLRNFSSIKDLQDRIVGANRDTYQELYLKEHYPSLKVVGFDYSNSMIEAADNGLIDAFIEESVTLKENYRISGKAFKNKALPDVSFRMDMLAGVSKNKPALLELVNEGLSDITEAEWQQLETKWIQDPIDRIYIKPVELQLTDAEKLWIRQHPLLRIGADKNQNPIQYQERGLPKGIATEYTRYILNRIGITPEIKLMDWPDILSGIRTGDTLDASFNIQKTGERSEYLAFSRPFLKVPHVIVTKAEKKLINSFSELSGLTVAVEKGYYKVEHFSKDPAITMLEVDSTLEALLAVTSGRADAYIGDKLTTTQYISANSLKNLRISEYMDLSTFNVSVGFRKELAPLADIINKVLDAMTESEKNAILSKYTSLSEEGSIHLSEAEQVWLRNHNPVRAGMQVGWAPIEYINELDELSGISSDYSTRFERIPNVQISPVQVATYSELVEMMRTGKLDIITAAVKSPYKFKYMSFSKPYAVSPMALITLDELPFVGGISDITTERLGVIQDSFAEDMLKLNHSDIGYQLYPDADHLYQALADGKVDLILDSMITIDYMSRLKGIANLRVSSITEYNYEICIGIRKDWPTTLIVVNKLLDSINAVEKESFEKYWLSKLPTDHQSWERYRNLMAGVSAVALLIVGVIAFWNRRLQKEINERKQIEIQLTAAKEAADVANRSKTEFLANMSHEIRTPMNAVIGMATLMGRTELSHQQRSYLTNIIQATYNLLNIINGILDFSKIEAGRMDLEEVEFELDAVMDNVANIIGIRAKDKELELIISKDCNVPVRLVGDPLRLEQILINLASNAIKFTPSGEVEIHIDCTRREKGRVTLKFSVRDTGIGMSDDQMSQLFKPFTQTDSSTTRRFGGTGLGLSISKKLVELMGGRIWAMCQLGGGCQFNFEIGLQYIQDVNPIYRAQSNTLGNLRVMVVEDNPSAREVLEGYLRDFNFISECFESGEKALEAFRDGTYDLVLMDWKLEGIDGLESVRRIKAMELGRLPKIIMVTAYGNEELVESIKEEGLDGILMKPVSESALFNAIQNAFSGKSEPDKWSAPLHMRLNESFLKGHSILVVEDNEMNQQLARELLSSAGANVAIAENGQDALNQLQLEDAAYDLIFMDLQMPEMDGFQATAMLRELARWHETPVIAMTADVLPGIFESCVRSGMNDYIAKPISVDELYDKLAFWLELREPYYHPETEADKLHLSLTGADSRKAIKNLGGSIELYKLVLERFAETYRDFEAEAARLLQQDTREDARRYFHTLKGHGGNIGSDIITKEAETAEMLLTNGEEHHLKDLLASMGRHMRALVTEIDRVLMPEQGHAEQTEPWQVQDLIRHLEAMLPVIKARKPVQIQEGMAVLLGKGLPEPVADECEALKKLCDRYKYKEAGELVEEIVERLRKI